MPETPTFFEAYDEVLTPLLGAHGLIELLEGAEEAGLVSALREQTDVAELAASTGLPEHRVRAVCAALSTYDVVEAVDTGLRLTPAWQALVAPGAFVALADLLASARIEARLLREAASGVDYWSMPGEDRVLFARAISPNPFSADLVEAFRAGLSHDPTAADLASGGLLLELGCGVAGRVLTMLQALPQMRAVGVELSDDLAAEARRRANELGVADRFEVVTADAGAFDRPGEFDVVFWSQFFFPEAARAGALRTAYASLRSGGLALAPLLGDDAVIQADPRGAEARHRAVFRVILDGWGIPDRDRDQLAAEFEDVGFVEVHFIGGGAAGPVRLVARKP